MRCHICNAEADLKWDHKRPGELLPCAECLTIIQDSLDTFKDPDLYEEDIEQLVTQRTV